MMTATWLLQLGWKDIWVLKDGLADPTSLERGPEARMPPSLVLPTVAFVAPQELAEMQRRAPVAVIDLDTSLRYRAGHVPGAWFAVRARLGSALHKLPPCEAIVATSEDGVLAQLAAPEIAAAGNARVLVLQGGTRAWRAAKLP